MTPTLIITRPEPCGTAFADALRQAWDGELNIIQSPLLRIVPVEADLPDVAGVIFTSTNGVAQSERLGLNMGLPAWCVGQRTAEFARQRGFDAIAGPGNASQLTNMILTAQPTGPLAHVRGRHARGEVSDILTAGGLHCIDVVAYDQLACPLSEPAKEVLAGNDPVVTPLFSARTATLLKQEAPFTAPIHVVAISTTAVPSVEAKTRWLAETPDGPAMMVATIACLAALNGHGG